MLLHQQQHNLYIAQTLHTVAQNIYNNAPTSKQITQ